MKLHRMLPAVIGAVATLAIGAAYGAARDLSISNRGIRATWSSATLDVGVRCAMTLEGTLHERTWTKVGGLLIGHITRARIARPCIEGEAWVLTNAEGLVETLPWHVRYNSFTGSLPNISSVTWQVVGMSWITRVPGFPVFCLARSTEVQPVFLTLNLNMGTVTSVNLGGRIRQTPAECLPEPTLAGTGAMTLLETATRITITLI